MNDLSLGHRAYKNFELTVYWCKALNNTQLKIIIYAATYNLVFPERVNINL